MLSKISTFKSKNGSKIHQLIVDETNYLYNYNEFNEQFECETIPYFVFELLLKAIKNAGYKRFKFIVE